MAGLGQIIGGGRWDQAGHSDKLPPLNPRMLVRLFHYMRPYAAKRNLLFALTMLRALQKPALAWMIPAIISGPISNGDWSAAVWCAVGFALMNLFTEGTFHFRQRMALEVGECVVHDLRRDLFDKLHMQTLSFFERVKLGNVLSRVISDIENVRRGVQQVFFFSILLFGQMFISAVLMFITDRYLFALLLLVGPVLYAMNRFFHRRMSRWSRRVQSSQSAITGRIAETVNGIRVIQSFQMQGENQDGFVSLLDQNAQNHNSLARNTAVFLPLLDLNTFVFSALIIGLGGWSLTTGHLDIGLDGLISFYFLAQFFFAPIQNIGRLYSQAVISLAGAERVFSFIDSELDWTQSETVSKRFDLKGQIKFENISFSYIPRIPVLREIDFSVKPGQTVALVGHTGSGKTTLFNLLCKFYLPNAGRILMDGQDISCLDQTELRRKISMVPQNPFLFSGNVMDNIRVGRPEATDAEIHRAVDSLDCRDLFERLPDGLLTDVGEHGKNISNGQRQLICFVRALIRDPRIVLLDEATSSIDILTEKRIQHALRRLLEGRTSLVIAHRLSTIVHADRILVMEQGRIVEDGNHASLVSRPGGIYASLYREFGSLHAA